jgi:hypothetical protein
MIAAEAAPFLVVQEFDSEAEETTAIDRTEEAADAVVAALAARLNY